MLGTEAGLAATERVIATLHPLLNAGTRRAPIGPPVEAELAALRAVARRDRGGARGTLPPNRGLTTRESERCTARSAERSRRSPRCRPRSRPNPPKPIGIPKKGARIDP